MKKVFIDTNVIMDFLIDRKPYSGSAAKIFTYAEKQEIIIYVSSLSFSKIYYITRKFIGHEKAIDSLRKLERITKILGVDETIIKQSLNSEFKDFEDAIQNYCASQIKEITTIITRNIKDYSKSKLAIHTPESYLKIIEK